MNPLYLAYGSNLHPLRLRERVPSARCFGTIALLGRMIAFHKRSDVDGSGKADLVTGETDGRAYGAVFEIDPREKHRLDAAEGLGIGYRQETMRVQIGSERLEVFTYLANPTHLEETLSPFTWYKALVLAGARYHGFPEDYMRQLEAVPAIEDPDEKRQCENQALLKRLNL
jgi:gamma-glutamylcyclotransferase